MTAPPDLARALRAMALLLPLSVAWHLLSGGSPSTVALAFGLLLAAWLVGRRLGNGSGGTSEHPTASCGSDLAGDVRAASPGPGAADRGSARRASPFDAEPVVRLSPSAEVGDGLG